MPATRVLTAALALVLISAVPARATSVPTLTVIDSIRPGPDASYALDASTAVALGDYLYFAANDGTNGTELWRTNGTTTTLVQDIRTGSGGSSPYGLTAFGDYLYFRADDDTNGRELWRTNGTTTTLVQDIYPGSNNSDPYGLTALGDYLYFNADDGTNGYELWRTNGTTTTLVQDVRTGEDSSYPYGLIAFGDYLYFAADDNTNGYELWRTNGTTTTLVHDIRTGSDGSYPDYFTALGDYLYFQADDGTNGYELWRTDGAVTERVPFPIVGAQYIDCDCYETSIVAVGGRLFTTVYSDDTGNEFAYLDEPTYVLPETNRGASVWTTTLVILAGLTAAASIGLRVRGATRI